MSPYLSAWVHRKSVSFVKKQPHKASLPPVRDPHPAPKPGSVGETRPRRTTPGFSDSRQDLRRALFGERLLRKRVPMGPNRRPDPGTLSPLLSEMPFPEATPEWSNSRQDPIPQENNPPPAYTLLDLGGSSSLDTTLGVSSHNATPQRQRQSATSGPSTTGPASASSGQSASSSEATTTATGTGQTGGTSTTPSSTSTSGPIQNAARHVYENVTLETLRAHNPPTRTPRPDSYILEPPPHGTTTKEVADAAACKTLIGITRAFDEQDPRMVAARTAQAIAVAVSTSRSHTAFLAAVTSAEAFALLSMEDSRYQVHVPYNQLKDRYTQAISIASSTGMVTNASVTATDPWLSNTHKTRAPAKQQQKQQPRTWVGILVIIGFDWVLVTLLWWAVKVAAGWILKT